MISLMSHSAFPSLPWNGSGKTAYLPKLESQLLIALIENRGMLVSKNELKTRLWGKLVVSTTHWIAKYLAAQSFVDMAAN